MSRPIGSPSVNFKYVTVACIRCGREFTRKAIANRAKWCPDPCAGIRARERHAEERRRARLRRKAAA